MTLDEAAAQIMSGDRVLSAGVLLDTDSAASALKALQDVGFRDRQIGVALRAPSDTSSSFSAYLIDYPGQASLIDAPTSDPTLVAGALSGVIFLTSNEAEQNSLVDILKARHLPENYARRLDQAVRQGGILITIWSGERRDQAKNILRAYGSILVGDPTILPPD